MAARAKAILNQPVLKLKLSGDLDLAGVQALRTAPAARLLVYATESWSSDHYQQMIPALEEFGVELIEQPFPANADQVLETLDHPIPVCADDAACSTFHDGQSTGHGTSNPEKCKGICRLRINGSEDCY
jgi:L-alanine-DL-glutamate epimerase-like enolase superfamily enzyme